MASLEAAGTSLDLAEARLLLSQVALAEGDLIVAGTAARAARRHLVRQGRTRWAALARFAEAQSRWSAGAADARIPMEAGILAGLLREQELLLPSLECRLIGARVALGRGDKDTAESLLNGIDGRMRSGPAAQRVRGWYGEAMGRLAVGNRSGALSALRAGLEVADDHRATLGATELRVRTATTVSELAELGLDIAFGSGRAIDVLRWSERWRAGVCALPGPCLRATRSSRGCSQPCARPSLVSNRPHSRVTTCDHF